MIVYPAIDLKAGRVVQWIGGRPESERLSLPDPVAVSRRFLKAGFAALHLVDLDAALGQGSNRRELRAVIEAARVPVQVGGGIRDRAAIDAWLAAGASRVIIGTRAVTDPAWLRETIVAFPGRLLVAADVRNGEVVTHGWTRSSGRTIEEFLATVEDLALAGLLITDVGREGSLRGIDAPLFTHLVSTTTLPIIAAGGIGDIDDLRALDGAGIAGAVVGTALYTGAVDFGAVAEEFQG